MTALEKDIQALRKDIQNIKSSLGNNNEKSISGASSKISFLRPDELRSFARNAGKEVSAYMHEKGDQVRYAVGKWEGTVKKHPLATTAAVFAAGAILASLFRRK